MSDKAFQASIDFILPHEEEFARGHWGDENYVVTEDVPGDSGGLTKYGIDAASNPGVDIANLTKDQAVEIYRQRYWLAHNLDALPDKLAIVSMDVWVNGGHANLWLQQAYNDVCRPVTDLDTDGDLGPVSLAALNATQPSDQDQIVNEFIAERNARFRLLAQNPSRAKFLDGWLERDQDLENLLRNYSA